MMQHSFHNFYRPKNVIEYKTKRRTIPLAEQASIIIIILSFWQQMNAASSGNELTLHLILTPSQSLKLPAWSSEEIVICSKIKH